MRRKTRDYYTQYVSVLSLREEVERISRMERECERAPRVAWVPQMTPTEPIVRTNQIAVLSMWLCGIPC